MRGLKGKALLRINDHPDVRACFAGLHVEEIPIKYTVGGGAGVDRTELLFSNWDVRNEPSGQFEPDPDRNSPDGCHAFIEIRRADPRLPMRRSPWAWLKASEEQHAIQAAQLGTFEPPDQLFLPIMRIHKPRFCARAGEWMRWRIVDQPPVGDGGVQNLVRVQANTR